MSSDPEAGGPRSQEPETVEPSASPSQEPETAEPGGWPEDPGAWESPEEKLRRLEHRLDRASEAAERLMAEAAAEAARARVTDAASEPPPSSPKPPPAGWQAPDDAPRPSFPDLEPLLQLILSFRDLIPPDLQQRLAAAIRELLLALRALIDWYLERFEERQRRPVEVQDIPIQ